MRFPLLIQLMFEIGIAEFKPHIRSELTLKQDLTPNVYLRLLGQFSFKLYNFPKSIISNQCFSLQE